MEYGNDPSVDAAAAKLLGRFTAAPEAAGEPEKKQRSGEAPAQDQEEIPLPGDDVDVDGYKPDEALTEGDDALETNAEGDEAQRLQDELFELPGEEEGAEAEMIPRADAIAAVRKMRQLDGDVASAVIRAEEEAYTKHDAITQQLSGAFETVEQQGKVALRLMEEFLPYAPSEELLNRNSQHYDPETYWVQRNYYDRFVAHKAKVESLVKSAGEGLKATNGQQNTELERRETERAARYIPEFKTENGRNAWKDNAVKVLGAKYGITRADIDEMADHRAVRIIDALAKAESAAVKAPEVRKAVTAKAPKLDAKGGLPPRDKSNGQFVSEAKKRLQAEGSEAAFANKLLVSGFLNRV